MAEPNGNGLSLDLTQKKLGLTGPNVALLLLIILIGVVAYLRTGKIDATLQAGQAQLTALEERVNHRVDVLFTRIDTLIADTQAQNILLNANNAKITTGQHELRTHLDDAHRAQGELLHQQTTAIDTKFDALKKYTEDWFTEMGRRQELMNFNVLNPDRALPLRGPAPQDDRHPERGR